MAPDLPQKGNKPQLQAWIDLADRQLGELERQRRELDITIADLRSLRDTAANEI